MADELNLAVKAMRKQRLAGDPAVSVRGEEARFKDLEKVD